jgi:hypothetical protein
MWPGQKGCSVPFPLGRHEIGGGHEKISGGGLLMVEGFQRAGKQIDFFCISS